MSIQRIAGLIALVCAAVSSVTSAAITFVPGNYYGTNNFDTTVRQFDANGNVVGSLSLGAGTRGLTFGRDNLLYVVNDPKSNGFTVSAINSSGAVVRTYTGYDSYGNNLTYGGIAVDSTYIYTAGFDTVSRFRIDSPGTAPTTILTGNSVFDVKAMPNGNLLVAEANVIKEITPAGVLVKETGKFQYTEIRSAAYDAATDSLFIGSLGNSGTPNKLYKLRYSTGAQLAASTVSTRNLLLDQAGRLIVGSDDDLGPQVFTKDLAAVGRFAGDKRVWNTQFIPEPSCVAALAGAGGVALRRRRR